MATALPGAVAAQDGDPVAVCELAYYTGEFGAYGPSLTNDVVFPVVEVINNDPPLGRTWDLYHEDLGTNGEAQAYRTCVEQARGRGGREHRPRLPYLSRRVPRERG